jgi:hypothetical protein
MFYVIGQGLLRFLYYSFFNFFLRNLCTAYNINKEIVTENISLDSVNVSEHLGLLGFCSHQQGENGGQGGLIFIYFLVS